MEGMFNAVSSDISTFGQALSELTFIVMMVQAVDGFYVAVDLEEHHKSGTLHNHFITCILK